MKLEVCSISSEKSLSKPYVLIGTKSVSKDQIMDADQNFCVVTQIPPSPHRNGTLICNLDSLVSFTG
jgi:hypothetical protein